MNINNLYKNATEPMVAHRFTATFFLKNIPSPFDLSFQSISGLGRTLNVESLQEGGDNTGNLHLPTYVTHGNIVLERGVMVVTPLTLVFDQMLDAYKDSHSTIVILLLNQRNTPVCSWTLTKALPVRWDTDTLDANSNKILINTLELAYENMHWFGVKA